MYNKWPSVDAIQISNDGQYAMYSVRSGNYFGRGILIHKIVMQSTDASWKMQVPGISSFKANFSADSKRLFFINPGDSLCIVRLGTSDMQYISGVGSFHLSKEKKNSWIAYSVKNPAGELRVKNLDNGKELVFDSIDAYQFSNDGNVLLVKKKTKDANMAKQLLLWVDLQSGDSSTIWSGRDAGNLILDHAGRQLAFMAKDSIAGKPTSSIWYYKKNTTGKAIMIADDRSGRIEEGFELASIDRFSEDGKQLFIELKQLQQPVKSDPDAVKLNIWSYMDGRLPSNQLKQPNNDIHYKAAVHLDNHKVERLLQANEDSWLSGGDYLLINRYAGVGDRGERLWNKLDQATYYLKSISTGKEIPLPSLKDKGLSISPGGKYLIYFDTDKQSIFSYEISTGIIRNITKGVNTTWQGEYGDDWPGAKNGYRGYSPAGWLQDDKSVLIYDRYDIWQLDPSGTRAPINLTNGYGRKHHIIFYLMGDDAYIHQTVIKPSARLILTAFNTDDKDNGFYSKTLGKKGDPELLTMGPYIYNITSNPYLPDGSNFTPVKARDADVYIVRRESATQSPNYFSTTDFKTFTRLSDIHPEKGYNWYTSELHNWKSLDGRNLQGILFKPENFDPNKKYPVILFYYERRSDGLNAYIKPENLCNGCTVNIPTYVSNNYLVFEPDIHYQIGNPMQGTYNSVVSAAKYISTLPYVNSKKLGLQGCSWGGIQTDYLVTHTSNLFAAACPASGESDFISFYGSLDGGNGQSQQSMFENGQTRMGATPWELPDNYIKSSAIYNADKVTTPLLIMHTTDDGRCPFYDAVTFFTALRRLGKKAWMLEYTDGNHGVSGKSADDFSLRMRQFFDYYLKDKPAPKWMVKSIPAGTKAVEASLQLMPEGVKPGANLLTPKEQKKTDALLRK
ncbi:alpha/beta hydrolase family protein [Arachidicoccus terrestris]|uniref:alpha/beta hydrolase family protein n=1 Tax=Arachidicoccus terrestris TaxID=2875539 RepID=UPI001CC7B470|nr:prolyl oligopeptidase family serine peptidase [Arachidicoccus terrestris]UAY55741.1 prolyl oligopeptidase family serine peptidase [Arachidicoccus terrestris]